MTISRPVVAGLIVAVLWASAFPAIRVAAPALGSLGLSIVRLDVAAVVLLAIAPAAGVRLPRRADLPLVVVAGSLGMTAYQVLLNWGELTVPAGAASIVIASAPIVSVAVAAIAFGERPTPLKVAGCFAALGGVTMVAVARGEVEISTAVWIVVAAAVVQGFYHPLIKPLLQTYTGIEVATYGMVVGAVSLLPLLPAALPAVGSASGAGIWSAVYLGLVPSATGFVLWGYAVARLPIATATSFLYLVPAFATVIAFFWLHEAPAPLELLGGAVAIAGVMTVGLGDTIRTRRAGVSAAKG